MSRDCTSWDGTFGDRGARLATTEDARELRVERRDEYIGIGAIARSSLEVRVRPLVWALRCDCGNVLVVQLLIYILRDVCLVEPELTW
jgi:hypothetical protein